MKIEQIYTGCLSQGAYYIESNGEVAIIDPLREVKTYIEKAKADNAKIKYIFETHFHADFVSGHVTLSKETGAPIVFGPNAETSFDSIIAKNNQVFKLGNITITVLHTPGHTMESSVYLLKDENGKDHAIFSGDTLFLGDVGRPDLAQKTGINTAEDLAGFLFDSLRTKIMPLADDVIVYPAHGAGSSCGKKLSKETVDLLGNQKKTNYALRADMTKDEFIKEVTAGLIEKAQASINQEKQAALAEIKKTVAELSIGIAETVIKKELSNKKDQLALVEGILKDVTLN
jgi:glyoxylase-like metal-dependent hydrolase (beta-lactamase superfamily II)